MYLTTLALLQAFKIPNNDFLSNVTHYAYSSDEWQCTALPSSFSQSALQRKCPSLLNELNVCCAVWNDCYEQKKGETYCNKQYYGCNQVALSSASPQDFEQCQRFPAEVKDHLKYISPRTANFVLPGPSLPMAETGMVAKVYESCQTKRRTFSVCLHNLARDEMAFSHTPELQKVIKNITILNMRVCLEMALEPEDGEECKKNVENLLTQFDKGALVSSPIKKVSDRSEWKCGANHYDTYMTQVLSGMGCHWLKEALNTCCKYHNDCYERNQNKAKCDKSWDLCNSAVITNGDGTVVQECTPFTDWVSHFQTLSNVYVYEYELVVEDNQLYILVVLFLCTLTVLLAAYFIISVFRRPRTQQEYDPSFEKLSTNESLPSV